MILTVIESPFAGDVEANVAYLRECLADSLARGEAPYASHGLYTQPGVLDDTIPEERRQGIDAGFAWGRVAELRAVYVDRGISSGMLEGIEEAIRLGQRLVFRRLRALPAPDPGAVPLPPGGCGAGRAP